MHYQWAEVAPAAPLLIDALPALTILAALLVAFGIVYVLDGFVRALFGAIAGILSHVPLVGSVTAGVIHDAEHAISHALGAAISGIESRIGQQFHKLARVFAHFWHELERTAQIVWHEAQFLTGIPTLKELGHIARVLHSQIAAAVHVAQLDIRKAIRHEEKALASVAQGIYPRIRALEHDVTRTIPKEIKSARALAREAEDGVARLWKAVRAIPGPADVTAAVATAIAALGLVGLDLLKCAESGNAFRNWGCSLWSRLETLLPLAFFLTLAFDFPEFVAAATIVADGIGGAVASIEGTLDLTLDPLPPPQS